MSVKGYVRVCRADAAELLERQRAALQGAGVPAGAIFSDVASGKQDERPGLAACLETLGAGDVLVVWRLDRLGRDLAHLVAIVHDLTRRDIGLRVLTGAGAVIDTTVERDKLLTRVFAALAKFDRDLVSERARAARLPSERARGRKPRFTVAKLLAAMAAIGDRNTTIVDLCRELGVNRSTLYRYVSPRGELRPAGKKLLAAPSLPEGPGLREPGGEKPLAPLSGEV